MTTTSKKHVHHDIIVEWAKDPSRKIQFRLDKVDAWSNLTTHPTWIPSMLYRFKPEPIVIKYREYIYTINGTYRMGVANADVDEKYVESMTSFVEWRGGWKTFSFEPCPQG